MPFTLWRRKGKGEESPPPTPPNPIPLIPSLKIEKSLTQESIYRSKGDLRLSMIEKEIIGEGLTRLFDAAAEGRITQDERDKLVSKYREQISKLDTSIDHNQKVIGLYELEESRAELIKMFHDKFEELNVKIGYIRKDLGVAPKEISEIKIPPLTTPTLMKEPKPTLEVPPMEEKPSTPPAHTPKKRKADEEVEKMRVEMLKELERLEQMEIE